MERREPKGNKDAELAQRKTASTFNALKDFQNLIDEYRPSVQVALNEVADSANSRMQIRVGLNCAVGIRSAVQTKVATIS